MVKLRSIVILTALPLLCRFAYGALPANAVITGRWEPSGLSRDAYGSLIVVHGDGTAIYEPYGSPPHMGTLPPEQLARLEALFAKDKFFALDDKYVDARVQDAGFAVVSFESSERRKSIDIYGETPPTLVTEIQKILLEAIGYLPIVAPSKAEAYCALLSEKEQDKKSCIERVHQRVDALPSTMFQTPLVEGWNAATLLYGRVTDAFNAGDYTTALARAAEYRARFPDNPQGYKVADIGADCLAKLGRWSDAVSAYENIRRDYPHHAGLDRNLFNEASILKAHDHCDRAAALFDQVAPDSVRAPAARKAASECRQTIRLGGSR